jgi:uncharacterized repeat protein (TIGR03803 family)
MTLPAFESLEDRLLLSAYTLQDVAAWNAVGATGCNPYAGLLMDGSGNLYGTTSEGGADGDGIVFELAKGSSTIIALASFNGDNGSNPQASLIVDAAGNLYGTTYGGGASGDGTVFEVVKGSGAVTTLASFNGANGSNPQAGLLMDAGGNLYGTTWQGGLNSDGSVADGTVFEVGKGSGVITTLALFNGTNGSYPAGNLIIDAAGNLYGATSGGGANGDGAVFEVGKGSGTITALASFSGTDGSTPMAGLLMDGAGNLYGTTEGGGDANGDGTVFEVGKGSGTITTLASFDGTNGSEAYAALVMDAAGNLYGTTYSDDNDGDGTVFEVGKGSGTITTLASFSSTSGSNPYAGLIISAAGNLYGTTYSGGANGGGTVFEVVKGSGTITTLASFNGTNGSNTQAGLIMDAGGNLYGTTFGGGAYGDGTVFEVASGSGTITTLALFNGANGFNPIGNLVMDVGGNLYGTTYSGGAYGDGTVFEVASGSGTITTLASFNGANGSNPCAGLIMDSHGNLYGTASGASDPSDDGIVFEVAKGSGTITTLASFNGTDGSTPMAELVMDAAGNLYGTTECGGDANGDGTVFEVVHGSGMVTTLASFDGTHGSNPQVGLTMDGAGNLFGTTVWGGTTGEGTVFEVVHGSGTITALASFNGANGSNPHAGLIIDSLGNLYGTTSGISDASDDGTVFEIASGSGTITTLASFDGANGSTPYACLLMDAGGNLYGTTAEGGPDGDGTVFELSPQANVAPTAHTLQDLAAFTGIGTMGSNPQAGLFVDSSGNLYGTTAWGGANGDGTIFEVASGSGTITTLASFNGANGSNPEAGLFMDSGGNLYGTTSSGGANGYGTVFEVAHGSGTITTLASFNGANGSDPQAGLIMDSLGNLYGTASGGGADGDGTVFEMVKGSGAITTLASFDGANGSDPEAGLIMDGSGNLYGTTSGGGDANGYGTVFEVVKGSGAITTLASFNGADGSDPEGGVVMDGIGNLYGTTECGGDANGDGTVFEMVKGSGTITTLAAFNGTNGSQPYAGLTMDGGNLYGTTAWGGANGDGTVFEVAGGSGTITLLASLSGTNGSDSEAGLAMDGGGNLYGTTAWGGAGGDGAIFELSPAATVTRVSSTQGPLTGGTVVTITGTSLLGATAVYFGTVAASSFTVISATQITATSPAGTAGTVDVSVTTAGGTSAISSADRFTYVAAPAVAGINLASGSSGGGTTVIITGTNLAGATAVYFGTVAASSFTINSATQITATSPAGTAGTVDVSVTTVGGTSATSPADQFTYIAPPVVAGISLTSGPLGGGVTIIITGTNLAGVTAVYFGTVAASSFTVNSATQITATSPAGSVGTVDVKAAIAGITSATSSADQFTYLAGPVVTGVSSTSASGAYKAGTLISITVAFNGNVLVSTLDGVPTLSLNDGATARYAGGSGTGMLKFNYTVSSGQNTAGLDYASTSALTLNGATIRDASGNNAFLALPSPGAPHSLGAGNNIVINTTAPTVTGLSVSDPLLADGDAGSGKFVVTATFSEAMKTTVKPTLTFTPSAASTLTLSGGTWLDGTHYQATYNVADAGVRVSNVGIGVTGAQDAAGNVQTAFTGPGEFSIAMQNPTVTSLLVNIPLLSDASAGSGTFAVTATYNAAMNMSINPTITFAQSVAGTLTLSGGAWIDSTHYQALYDVADAGVKVSNVGVGVSGAQDTAGNVQQAYAGINKFSIDTQNPTLTSVWVNLPLLSDASAGAGRFVVIATYSKAMNTKVSPAITFTPSVASTLTLSSGAWIDGTQYRAIYSVADAGVTVSGVAIGVTGAKDAAGNTQTAFSGSDNFSIDTQNPTVTNLSVNSPLLADANVGSGKFVVIATFSEPMRTTIKPTITFTPSAAGTLALAGGTWLDSTHYQATYNVADASARVSGVAIVVAGADDLAGNKQAAYTDADALNIDTQNPTVAVSVNTTLLSDASVGSGTFIITATYSKTMNTGIAPTLIFTPSAASTLTFSGGAWTDSTHYRATYNVADAGAIVRGIGISVTGAQDLAGNVQKAAAALNKFSIDTQDATVTKLSVNTAVLSDAYVGNGRFVITATFSKAMNTKVSPAITFTPSLAGTLTLAAGAWADSMHYRAIYNVADAGVTVANVGIGVIGAQDTDGNTQTAYSGAGNVNIDTQNPTATVSVNNPLILDAVASSGTFVVTVTYSQAMKTTVKPVITFTQSVASTLRFSCGVWLDSTHYVATYNVAGTGATASDVGIGVLGALDLDGNIQTPCTDPDEFSITA